MCILRADIVADEYFGATKVLQVPGIKASQLLQTNLGLCRSSSYTSDHRSQQLFNMSRTATSIELVDYPETPLPTLAAKPSLNVKDNDTFSLAEDLRPINDLPNTFSAEQRDIPGKGTTAIVLVTVVCVTLVSSMLSGVMTVTLPTVARELELAPSMLLWCTPLSRLPTCSNVLQAYFRLRLNLRLYPPPPRLRRRRRRSATHVPYRLSPPIRIHTGVRLGADWDTAHRIPCFRWCCDFVLSTFSR